MRTPTVSALGLLAAVAVSCPALGRARLPEAPSAAPTPAASRSAPGPTLEEALRDIAIPSGIRFRIEPALARDRIQARPEGTAWPEVVRNLLRGYNWAGTWDERGRLTAVSVAGRNGDGTAPASPAATAETDGLFAYRPPAKRLPEPYRTYAAGSVYPIAIPAGRLRQMEKGTRVAINLPDGRYVLVHDNAWRHGNGDLTWVGRLEGPEGHYRALLTLGDGGVEGQIRTPGGLYHLESEGSGDWLIDIGASGLRRGALDDDGIEPAGLFPPLLAAPAAAMPAAAASRALDQPNTARTANATLDRDGRAVIDVALLYTKGLANRKVRTRLNSVLAFANQALADSQANAVLRLAVAKRVGYPNGGSNNAALNALTRAQPGLENTPGLRDLHGADIVLLVRPFRPRSQGGNCGAAWVNGSGDAPLDPDLAYGVIGYGTSGGYYCSHYTLAHEIGHILGAAHDRPHATVPGKYGYSYGYGIHGRFGDIMSYADPETGLFANPAITACDGLPCGIPPGQPKPADVVRTFNNTMKTVSGFRKARSP